MPELPDLEVLRGQLSPRLAGAEIASARVCRPIIVRNLLGGDVAARLVGRRFAEVRRRGKFLLLGLDDGSALVVNPMLAGRIRLGEALGRDRPRDALVLQLAGGPELRYHDAAGMGKVYLTLDLQAVPGFAGQGPDADDPALTLEVFRGRLRRHPGEIKGVLTNQAFIAGIGNAYADEICWCAGVYPFRRRAGLSDDEVARLHRCTSTVLERAIAAIRERIGEDTDVEFRDFLAVHGKPGGECPRCGGIISEVKRQKRATHFCRHCQPGLLVAPDRRLPPQ